MTQKPGEWASALLARFEDQASVFQSLFRSCVFASEKMYLLLCLFLPHTCSQRPCECACLTRSVSVSSQSNAWESEIATITKTPVPA